MTLPPTARLLPLACLMASLCLLPGCQSDSGQAAFKTPAAFKSAPPDSRFGNAGVDSATQTAYPLREGAISLTDTDESLFVFDGTTGEPLTGRQVAARIRAADVVILGEMHTDPMAHRLQQRFVREALWQDSGALSIEMMTRNEQPVLTRLNSAPNAAEDQLAQTSLTGWPRWDQFYLPSIREALSMDRPVIASNAPREIVRSARLYGYDYLRELPPDQQRLFDLPQDVDAFPEYRERVQAVLAGHPASQPATQPTTRPVRERLDAHAPQDASAQRAGQAATAPTTRTFEQRAPGDPEAFFEAQLLWDATMAQSIISARSHGRPVVHLVGSFHSDFDGGLTQMLRRRGQRVLTVSFVPADSQYLAQEDVGRANIVIYTGADRPLPPESMPTSTQPATAPAPPAD